MNRRAHHRALLARLKDAPCTDCGTVLRPEAMDFDHVRGEKLGNVSDLVGSTTEALLAEVAKCELVCANCHRSRTEDRRADAHVDLALAYDVFLEGELSS